MNYEKNEIIYFLQTVESKKSQYPLVEIGATVLSFQEMDVLRKNGFEYNGAYWITKTNAIPITPKTEMYLKPQIVKRLLDDEPIFRDVPQQ